MKSFAKGVCVGVMGTTILTTGIYSFADTILKNIGVAENSVIIKVNNNTLTAPNFVYNGRAYVQVKDLTEALGKKLNWDAINKQVLIREYNIDNNEPLVYTNPIDAYFLPRIKDMSICEAEVRQWQDEYCTVWNQEFNKIMQIMESKCTYEKDKNNLKLYRESVNNLVDKASTILVTEWLGDYQLPPDSAERRRFGNGTTSGLKMKEAEILRDASMILIPYCDKYVYPKDFDNIPIP